MLNCDKQMPMVELYFYSARMVGRSDALLYKKLITNSGKWTNVTSFKDRYNSNSDQLLLYKS